MSRNTITRVKNTNRVVEIPDDIKIPAGLNSEDIGRKSFKRNIAKERTTGPVLNYAQSVNATIEKAIVEGRINFTNLPTYANNAAAVAGGLVVGRMYKTSAGVINVVV
jgi:hypothetical protein